ncbi:uncharacterized protein LOC103516011 isoform X2 [Diaphorina citri]|uniref:Uncharacterized protein LOC103516011 isoform X1 n=1 Tax=Diaphorina citri TaxID=121845 RepID=A0A1S4EJL3_DIACI|nr:uncharacterized protein LOC103516011 isoform X1 [Diaphorina citri]XP_026684327.1 uncharacterized protein LOC103516011 isoform X2 [Diaphorina citri]
MRKVALLVGLAFIASVSSSKVIDENSEEYKKALNEFLKQKGFQTTNSNQPKIPPNTAASPQKPQRRPIVDESVLDSEITPAGLLDEGQQPPVPAVPTVSSRFTKGLSKTRDTLYDVAGNQVDKVFDNVGDVIKGTDGFLSEKAYQFKRVNAANAKFLKQAAQTTGSAIVKVPTVGTNALGGVENVINEPGKYFNPFNIMWNMIPSWPWASKETEEETLRETTIQSSLQTLKQENPRLYMKLMEDNAKTYKWLMNHKDIFLPLLRDQRDLEFYLDNPVMLLDVLKDSKKP